MALATVPSVQAAPRLSYGSNLRSSGVDTSSKCRNAGVAVLTHGLGEVGVSLGARLGFVASDHGQAADKPQAVLCSAFSRLRLIQVVRLSNNTIGCKPIAVEAPNEHDLAVTDGAHVECGHIQTSLCGQPKCGTLHAGHIEAVFLTRKLGEPKHAMGITHRGFGPCTAESRAIDKNGFEVRRYGQPFFNAVCSLHEVR